MRAIRRLRGDERGALIVFFAVALAVLLGLVALSFDLGRVASTQSELQSFADSVALAAAAELDGSPTAITRAIRAAEDLIRDRQTFALNDSTLDLNDFTLTFLSALDPDGENPADDTVISPPYDAADAAKATLVRVDVDPHILDMGFASALSVLSGGGQRQARVAASATAGLTQYACDITPLMFCLPPGGVENGQMVNLVAGNGGTGAGAWGPGNFGFLDISSSYVDPEGACKGLNSANLTRCLLGAVDTITQCYSMRGVDTETGARIGITTDPFNFRFDMFPNSTKSELEDKEGDFAPAPNTIRGFVPTVNGSNVDWCKADTKATPTSMAFPRDDSLSETLRFGTDRTFEGDERTRYVAMNYGGIDPHEEAKTRWAYYLAEIEAAGGAASSAPILDVSTNPLRETGRAQCSAVQSNDPYRRVVVAAGINCDPANGGTEIKGNTTNVPVEEFFRVFLTEPVGTTGGTLGIYGEVIGSAGGTGSGGQVEGGIFRDVVQLYR